MADEKTERQESEYVVGEYVQVEYRVPPPSGQLDSGGKPKLTKAWAFLPVMEGNAVKRFAAPSSAKAIEQHTGRGKGAKEGAFKAVAFTSWKGTLVVERVVQDQRSLLEDE